jgi:hypothetical protein
MIIGRRSTDASTSRSIAATTPSSSASCIMRSSTEYPDRHSSGKIATATASSWHSRAVSRTACAFATGSASATGIVHAAMRA